MLGWRLLISAILVPAFAGLFWLDHRSGPAAPVLFLLCQVLAIRSTWEFCDLVTVRNLRPRFACAAVGSSLVVVAAWLIPWFGEAPALRETGPAGLILSACVLWLLGSLASQAVRFRAPGSEMETSASELLAVVYCGVLLAMTAQSRWLQGGAWGYLALGALVITVKSGDIGGYTLGRLFGRRKMAPHLSPGKTWAGFVGALLGAALGGWLWLRFATPWLAGPEWAVAHGRAIAWGLTFGLIGLVGDLCESLIKRDVGRKDAAALFPGFGGLLDLLDSVIYAGPVAWLWWLIWPPISAS
ncbi:MAG: phosphatidate cytidylyltransferase [Planctomyces sp.]|nr:phosphatidate cytidylyltransferase [Planctomyces sp.]